MKSRPLGIFDSGLGGLTVVPHLLRELPLERIVYFGDTARTPYGSKSVKTIQQFSHEIVSFLLDQGCKAILIACNTVSSTALNDLKKTFPAIPFISIIEPVVDEVVKKQKKEAKRLGVIGTKVTIESGVYRQLFKAELAEDSLAEKACPIFVPLIEEGLIDHAMMDLAIHYYLDDFIADNKLEALILGCTHYHLLEEKIQGIYPELTIINPAKAQVLATKSILAENHLLATEESREENAFYASDLSENFIRMINNICGPEDTSIEFKNLDL